MKILGLGQFKKQVQILSRNIKKIICVASILFAFSCNFHGKKNNLNNIPESNTVCDVDGNIYKTIKIGNEIWMQENLKVNF